MDDGGAGYVEAKLEVGRRGAVFSFFLFVRLEKWDILLTAGGSLRRYKVKCLVTLNGIIFV